MELHEILTDRQLEVQFEHCLLNPRFLTHETHLRLAWIHLQKYGLKTSIKNLSQQLRAFDQTYGKGEKYNEIVTIASLHAVHHCMLRSYSKSFHDFTMEFPQLKSSMKELLNSHYNLNAFNTPKACPSPLAFEQN